MKICPTCNESFPDNVDSCPTDGSRLVPKVRDDRECPYCAELILKKARVCKHCHRDVEPVVVGDAPVQTSSATPTQGTPEMRIPQAPASRPTAADRPPELGKSDTSRQTPSPTLPQAVPRPQEGNRFCPSCAAPTQAAQVVCVKCGVALRGAADDRITPSVPPKDPVLMAALSGCCLAGLGQIVLGQTLKGVIILVVSMLLGAVTMGVSILVTWPLGAVDAYMVAKKLKEGKTVGIWEFF